MENYFGRYQIIEELGQGGAGRVYKAYDQQLNRTVALKVLLSGGKARPQDVERFLREAKATAQLHHPNIVTIYDIANENGENYFTMEFVAGSSLQSLSSKGHVTITQAVDIMSKVCDAIHYAHSQGVIHRDIKPANIMLDKDKQPKVMDFGLAKLARESKKLSKSGAVLGTLQYMAPEQAEGYAKLIDARTDVYALGATLYELVTGRPPVTGSSYEILYKIVHADPVVPSQINPRVPKDLENIILKALQKQKDKRYSSAAELRDDLDRFRQGNPVLARPLSLYERLIRWGRRERWVCLVTALVLLAILTASSLFLPHRPVPLVWSVKLVDKDNRQRSEFLETEEVYWKIQWQRGHNNLPGEKVTIFGDGLESIAQRTHEQPAKQGLVTLTLPVKSNRWYGGKFQATVSIYSGGIEVEKQLTFRIKCPFEPVFDLSKLAIWEKEKKFCEDFSHYEGHHYLVVSHYVTWPGAKKICEELGGHLVTISDLAENTWVRQRLDQAKVSLAWLGLSDEQEEGKFRWITGEPLNFTCWQDKQPDNWSNEDYGEITDSPSNDKGRWNDLSDNTLTLRAFVCEWDR